MAVARDLLTAGRRRHAARGDAKDEPDAAGAYAPGAYRDRLAGLGAVKAEHDPTNCAELQTFRSCR